MADYYITGNRRLLDVALEAADHVVRVQNPSGILNCFYGNHLNREYVGPLSILMDAYQATWQERYGALAERSLAWLLRAAPKPGYLPCSVFTVGPRGDEAVVTDHNMPGGYCGNHAQAYAAALRLFPSRELKAFLIANADYWIWQHPGGGGGDAVTVCLAYDITGNPDYAAYLAGVLAGCQPSDPTKREEDVRSFWMYCMTGFLPIFMKTVADAMDRDPDGFADRVQKYREKRKTISLLDSPPSPNTEDLYRRLTELGSLETAPFPREP